MNGMAGLRSSIRSEIFGKRLLELRKEAGFSRVHVAERLLVSESMVAYYEKKSPLPSEDLAQRCAEIFDVSTSVFLEKEQETPRRKPGPRSKFDVRVDELKKLPPKQQELVLLMIDSFLAQSRKAS
ncbi:MAG: helix-turn-helix transcriptional regulator [Deltaproteobacteria bacterium]|nr:helix-turn-helix transcriptional regulator [Deltaproteobacteria bacterium]